MFRISGECHDPRAGLRGGGRRTTAQFTGQSSGELTTSGLSGGEDGDVYRIHTESERQFHTGIYPASRFFFSCSMKMSGSLNFSKPSFL